MMLENKILVLIAKGLRCHNKNFVFYSKGLGQLLTIFEEQGFSAMEKVELSWEAAVFWEREAGGVGQG